MAELAAVSATDLLEAAAGRLGSRCERVEIKGSERAVVRASAHADLLVMARDGEVGRLVTKHCVAAGLTGTRLDDFVLAVHEISANAILHAGATLADELGIASGPDSTIVSLYMRLD